MKPLMRSQLRAFILCGMALLPTWPALKPSVANSWPAISRSVVARLDGPAASCSNRLTAAESSERG